MRAVYALGGTLRMSGDLESAAGVLDDSLRVYDTSAGDDDAGHADQLLERGMIAVLQGDFEGALVHADRALALFGDSEGTLDEARVRMIRGNALRRLDRVDEARAEYARTREIYIRSGITNTIEYADLVNSMAVVYRYLDDYPKAEAMYKEALAIRLALDPRPDPGVAAILNNLGRALVVQQKTDEAADVIRRSVAMHRELFGSEHFGTAIAIATLAEVLAQQDKVDESLELYDEALALLTGLLGPEHPYIVTLYNNTCIVLNQAGRYEEALAILERALEIVETQEMAPLTYKAPLLIRMVRTLRGLGRHDDAEARASEAIGLFPPDDPRAVALQDQFASEQAPPPPG